MNVAVDVAFVVFMVGTPALAGVALWMVWRQREPERLPVEREAWLTEQRITEISLQAQVAILTEALRRAEARQAPQPGSDTLANRYGRYGPWND